MEVIVKRGEEQFGPFSLDQLREHLASGMILANDWAWHDGLSDWVPAKTLIADTSSNPDSTGGSVVEIVPSPSRPKSAPSKKAIFAVVAIFILGGGLGGAYFLGVFGGVEKGSVPTAVGSGLVASETGRGDAGAGGVSGGNSGIVEIPPVTLPVAPPVLIDSDTSFNEVTQKLDKGGSFYFYLSTDQAQQWMRTVFAEGGNLVKTMGAQDSSVPIGGIEAAFAHFARTGIEVGAAAYTGLGLDSIDGVGASTRDLGGGLKRNVAVMHHDPANGEGLIWKGFGTTPHELGALKLMPAETVMAAHGDLNLTVILQWVQAMVKDHGSPEMLGELNTFLKSPLLIAVNGGYGGEVGQYITFDLSKTIQVPMGNALLGRVIGGPDTAVKEALPVPEGLPGSLEVPQPIRIPQEELPALNGGIPPLPSGSSDGGMMEMPEPGIIITMKVKDNSIQKMIEGLISAQMPLQPVDLGGVTISQLSQPMALPDLPIPLQPAMFQVGDYFIITSTPALAHKVIAVHNGQSQGLKGTPQFQKISAGLPLKGNQLIYVDGRVSAFSAKMVKETISMGPAGSILPVPLSGMLPKLLTLGSSAGLSVVQMQPDGVLIQTHTEGMGYDTMALAGAMVAPVALGAIALGAGSFAEGVIGGRSLFDAGAMSAQKMNNGKQLAVGIFEYEVDNGELPKSASWCDEVLKQVKDEGFFSDPVFLETAAPGERVCVWLYNKHLSGLRLANIEDPAKTVLLYDAGLDWNGSAGKEEFFPDPESKIITVFVDGHVEQLGPQDAARIKWTP